MLHHPNRIKQRKEFTQGKTEARELNWVRRKKTRGRYEY
jgi:hypothetical protein